MLPWQIYQSYLSVRSRIRDVINLTYDVIEVTRYHSWPLYTLNIQPRCIKTQHSMQIERGTRWWRFHAATIDSFDAIDSWIWKIMEFAKIDLWPAITGSNIDLGPKIIPPIVSTRREQSAGLFREALRRFVWKRQGGGGSHQPPPPTPAKVAKHRLRARVKSIGSP